MSANSSFDSFEVIRFYVNRGLRVVPVWGIDDQGQCMCHAGATCPSVACATFASPRKAFMMPQTVPKRPT